MTDPVFEQGTTRRELLRRTGIGAAILAVPGAIAPNASAMFESANVKRGGRLRVAFIGAGPTETLDPNRGSAIVEIGMATIMFEKLFDLLRPNATLTPVLSEIMWSNKIR